jgi:hypothetical protein
MKTFSIMLMIGLLAVAPLLCRAEQACSGASVEASVEAGPGELTLADLLTLETCPQVRERAARVSLGKAPQSGSVRVLDGREVRRLLEGVVAGVVSAGKVGGITIAPRIVVRRRGATKSCADIARLVAGSAALQDTANAARHGQGDLDCAGARRIPEDAPLEVTKTSWSAALERWEFALRCARPGDCVPFLVWAHKPGTGVGGVAGPQAGASLSVNASGESSSHLRSVAGGAERLVAPGETATLTWDQAGIRVVLPVTCLDAGAMGQFVRVRLKNAARILRAEVVGVGTLRASL